MDNSRFKSITRGKVKFKIDDDGKRNEVPIEIQEFHSFQLTQIRLPFIPINIFEVLKL